jgi:hypothetical protein
MAVRMAPSQRHGHGLSQPSRMIADYFLSTIHHQCPTRKLGVHLAPWYIPKLKLGLTPQGSIPSERTSMSIAYAPVRDMIDNRFGLE